MGARGETMVLEPLLPEIRRTPPAADPAQGPSGRKVGRALATAALWAGLWTLGWELLGEKRARDWAASCDEAHCHGPLQCAASDWKLAFGPGLTALASLGLVLSLERWGAGLTEQHIWCADRGRAAAMATAVVMGAGFAVMGLWAGGQHWHDAFDTTTICFLAAGLLGSAALGAFAFRSAVVAIDLAGAYLDMLQLVALAVVLADQTYPCYPVPRFLGAPVLWSFVAWMSGTMLLQFVSFGLQESAFAFNMTLLLQGAGSLFLRGVVLSWELAYADNWARAVPLFTILGCATAFLRMLAASQASVVAPIDAALGEMGEVEAPSAQDRASMSSFYTFWWVLPTLKQANDAGALAQEDLPDLPRSDRPEALFGAFRDRWKALADASAITSWSLLYTISYKIQRRVFLSSLLHGWLFLALMLLDPILLNALLSNTSDEDGGGSSDDDRMLQSLVLVLVLSASMLVRVTCMEICYFESTRVNNNARTVLVKSILRKTLRAQDASRYSAGSLINLMATDADNIGKMSWMVFFFSQWTWAFASLPVVVYCMHQTIGNSVWIGIFTTLLGGVITRQLGRIIIPVIRRLQKRRDERSQLLKEILTSISVIKLQAWEEGWRAQVEAARRAEMREIVCRRLLEAGNLLIGALLNVAVPVSIFSWYTAVEGRELDSKTAFTTLAWISQMQWSINVLPAIYNMYAALLPSCERLSSFLGDRDAPLDWLFERGDGAAGSFDATWINELEPSTAVRLAGPATLGYRSAREVAHAQRDADQDAGQGPEQGEAEAGNGTAKADAEVSIVLRGLDLKVERGEFVIIAGGVGSGKSTLLAGLARGIEPIEGACHVRGSRAFVSQRPFLLNDSIRDNILFGRPLDPELYQRAVHGAALAQDLEALQNGDETVVGESGVQLSGGQKARVALARALYSEADCYFFDDVLSAVDATTGQFIWNETLIGSLRGKTVVLVTHQLQFLARPQVSRVVILADGTVAHQGPWADISSRVSDDITSFAAATGAAGSSSSNTAAGEAQGDGTGTSAAPGAVATTSMRQTEERHLQASSELVSLRECEIRLRELLRGQDGCVVDRKLVDQVCSALRGESEQQEKRSEGMIAWQDFRVYLGVFGSKMTLLALALALVFKAGFDISMNVWLSVWSDANSSSLSYLYVYIGVGVMSAVLASLESVMLTLCALQASRKIHMSMLDSLLCAGMSFFDRTPSGQIMNRFLQDLANIDNYVPNTVLDQITKTLNMVTQIGLVLLFAPWVLFSLPFIVVPYSIIFAMVRSAARDSRRLEAVAHSPVYTHFSDVLRGQQSIRAYAVENRFEQRNAELVHFMSQGRYSNEAICKWAQTLTTQNGCLLYLICGLICVNLVHGGSMTLGQFGLVLLYSANLQRASMDYMMGLTTLESQFVSVERVAQFTRTPSEYQVAEEALEMVVVSDEPENTPATPRSAASPRSPRNAQPAPPADWPTEGEVVFDEVKMRYALHRSAVLNGLSFRVRAGAKVALCGRTGCGKSSTFGALGRLYPIASGRITIDGFETTQAPLQTVRRALRVITQDSVLVRGTLRSNLTCLDPSVTDEDMWDALKRVEMKAYVEQQALQLDMEIEDGGKNLSVGQRQLLCSARALLRREGRAPRILLCDEATANIDLATDEKIHDVLLNLDATVIMICHRLQHIRRFDTVIVLGPSGTVLESGSPADLLADRSSALNDLFRRAGLAD